MYKIAICSHDRVNLIKKKTLKLLEKYQIPKSSIYIFVAPEEVAAYTAALPEYQIVQGALGLAQNRNAIVDYFPEGEYLVCMDDDLANVSVSVEKKLKPVSDLDALFRRGFAEVEKHGASLWGLFPCANASWLKPTVTVGLVFCYGCGPWGLINRKSLVLQNTYKEDFERVLHLYQRDGKVVRLNWAAPVQRYLKTKGGLSNDRTEAKEKAGCDQLLERYPDLIKYRRQTNGRHDLLFVKGKTTVYKIQQEDSSNTMDSGAVQI